MPQTIRTFFYISLISISMPVFADTNIAGVQLPGHYTIDGQSLVLNGAGVRSKFFVKVYVGALYLVKKQTSAEQVIRAEGPKSMQMHILYDEIEASKITEGWDEGFRSNTSADRLAGLSSRLAAFNKLFPALKKGDTVHMDYHPGRGTTVIINDRQAGVIEGEDFFSTLLSVWIGDHPADKAMKKGLLGN